MDLDICIRRRRSINNLFKKTRIRREKNQMERDTLPETSGSKDPNSNPTTQSDKQKPCPPWTPGQKYGSSHQVFPHKAIQRFNVTATSCGTFRNDLFLVEKKNTELTCCRILLMPKITQKLFFPFCQMMPGFLSQQLPHKIQRPSCDELVVTIPNH